MYSSSSRRLCFSTNIIFKGVFAGLDDTAKEASSKTVNSTQTRHQPIDLEMNLQERNICWRRARKHCEGVRVSYLLGLGSPSTVRLLNRCARTWGYLNAQEHGERGIPDSATLHDRYILHDGSRLPSIQWYSRFLS